MPNDPVNNDPAKILKAKLALTGQAEVEDWKEDLASLEKRRSEASKALASPEQKKAQEEIERAEINKRESQKKLAELEAVRRVEEENKKKKLAEEQRKKDEQAELERLAKIEAILKSQKEIETIKKDPQAGTTPIRTLTRDIGQAIQSEGLSATKIITNTPDEKKITSSPSRVWLVSLIAFLVIGGLFVGVWSIWLRQTVITTRALTNRQSLIFANKQIAIDLDKKSSAELLTELTTVKTNLTGTGNSETTEIYFTYQLSTTTSQGIVTTRDEAGVAIYGKSFGLNLPDDFTRQVEPRWMLGYRGEQASPFYIFKTKDYKNLADSLLKNEGKIVGTLLSPFLDASTTAQIETEIFRDKMVKNYDTRLVIDDTNVPIAIYSWLDQDTLLITINESVFVSILDSYFTSK